MTTFSDAFRRNVTVPAALSAMLYSEEYCGSETLAKKTQTAIENILSDIEMLSLVEDFFKPMVNDTNAALSYLIEVSSRLCDENPNLLPDEAVLIMLDEHQKRTFQTQQDAQDRMDSVHTGTTIKWEIPPVLVSASA